MSKPLPYRWLLVLVLLAGCAAPKYTYLCDDNRVALENGLNVPPGSRTCACGYWKQYRPDVFEKYCQKIKVYK